MNYEKELLVAKEIASEAGKIMLHYFNKDQRVQIKTDGSPVTIADTTINKLVIEKLKTVFPDDGVIGEEESTTEYGKGRKWFCDPIDGTIGYTVGLPTAMFSLSLVIDGNATLGVAYDPFLKRLFYAVRGQGAFCNDKMLYVSDTNLKNGAITITSNAHRIWDRSTIIDAIVYSTERVLCFNGAVYKSCLVATGNTVAYIEEGVNAHDMAAVHVIIEEAGGKVTGLDGKEYDYTKPFKGTIVSNGTVHDELVALINK